MGNFLLDESFCVWDAETISLVLLIPSAHFFKLFICCIEYVVVCKDISAFVRNLNAPSS